jgi:hypothetical protein
MEEAAVQLMIDNGTRRELAEANPEAYGAVTNGFYDQHTIKTASNVLGGSGATSCVATAHQTYSCAGNVVGTFTLTNTYTAGFIDGQPVTFVSVSKQ